MPDQNALHRQSPQVLLGFDFGFRHIGVAVGQTITQTAEPLTTLSAKGGVPKSWDTLTALIKKWQPNGFVVGIPLNMDGTPQPITDAARAFGEMLSDQYNIPWYSQDERLSTVAAKEALFEREGFRGLKKQNIDSMAAVLILEGWLTKP